MAYVPRYNLQPIQPIKPAGNAQQELLGNIMKMRDQRAEDTRLKNKALQVEMDKLSIGELVTNANTKAANEAYNAIVGEMTDAMMYRTDANGNKVKRESSFFGPQIDDYEYQNIMNKVREADQYITELRAEEAQVKEQEKVVDKEMMTPTGKIDAQRSKALINHYYETGEFPEDGMFVVPNGVDPDVWTRDNKYYLKSQRASRTADGKYSTVPDAPQEYQRAEYFQGMLNPQNQAGMANKMLQERESATMTIAANLVADGIPEEQAMAEANKLMNKFESTGKVPAQMAEGVIEWGYNKGYWKNIGKGSTVRTAAGAGDGTDVTTPPQTRSYNVGPYKMKEFVDLGTLPSGQVNVTTQLPAGTRRLLVEDGKVSTKEMTKNPPETNQNKNYKVVGYDKEKNMIVMRNVPEALPKERASEPTKYEQQYEYLVPYRGNEYLLREPTKTLGQPGEQQTGGLLDNL